MHGSTGKQNAARIKAGGGYNSEFNCTLTNTHGDALKNAAGNLAPCVNYSLFPFQISAGTA